MYLSAAFDLHLYAHWSMYVWEGQLMCLHVFLACFCHILQVDYLHWHVTLFPA